MTTIPLAEKPGSETLANSSTDELGLLPEWRELRRFSYLLYLLVHRDLTVRYKRSVIGFFWTLLNPLLMMVIFTVVFSAIFRFAIAHYQTYFLSEYVPWVFFTQTTMAAMASVAWNGGLMKKVRVPKTIFPLATTIAGIVNFFLSLIPLFVIMFAVGAPIRPAILFLPVSIVILALFTFGVSLALSSLVIYFTDIREMYAVAVAALMYLTPIMYPITIIPDRYRWFVKLNPLVYLMEIIRDPIYYGIIPSPATLSLATVFALGSLIIGWIIFRNLSKGFYAHL